MLLSPRIRVGRVDDSYLMLLAPDALRTVVELEVDAGSWRCHHSEGRFEGVEQWCEVLCMARIQDKLRQLLRWVLAPVRILIKNGAFR